MSLRYKIYLNGAFLKEVNELSALLEHLEANTSYSVQVSETDGIEESALSEAVHFKTEAILATGITLNVVTKTLLKGATFQLTATVSPSNTTDKTVTWTSSDKSIASVNSKGFVTALKVGTVTITAHTANNLTASCTLTITTTLKPPVNLVVSEVTATSAKVTWKNGE